VPTRFALTSNRVKRIRWLKVKAGETHRSDEQRSGRAKPTKEDEVEKVAVVKVTTNCHLKRSKQFETLVVRELFKRNRRLKNERKNVERAGKQCEQIGSSLSEHFENKDGDWQLRNRSNELTLTGFGRRLS
jgi:hypothetical protein